MVFTLPISAAWGVNGLGMLVAQAQRASEIFRNVQIDDAVIDPIRDQNLHKHSASLMAFGHGVFSGKIWEMKTALSFDGAVFLGKRINSRKKQGCEKLGVPCTAIGSAKQLGHGVPAIMDGAVLGREIYRDLHSAGLRRV